VFTQRSVLGLLQIHRKGRDAESGLDNFGARHCGSNLGRFLQTDPIWVKAFASVAT